MRTTWVCAALLALLLAVPGASARAGAKSGFGVLLGAAHHTATGEFIPPYSGAVNYASTGLSLGLDYQVALGERFSINPFLQSSAEGTSGDLASGVTAGHGVLGLELRVWPSSLFLGAHAARYTEVLTSSGGTASISASGNGTGASLGWEGDNGLSIVLQADTFKLAYSDSNIDVNAVRVHVGYRWR